MMNFLVRLLFVTFLTLQVYGYNEVCYDGYGCFNDGPPWGDTPERPVGHVPRHPDDISTRFYLDTRIEENVEVLNDDISQLAKTTFDPLKPTKFIIHGFIQFAHTSWMKEMSTAFRDKEDVNVFRVGWFRGSFNINYPQSATDTQIVGREVGLLIKNIVSYYNPPKGLETFHCIGHSLGAQTCGYAGASFSPDAKIGRITGLDPAGPYFEGTPTEVRLDSSDADFVDVIHSDAEGLADLGMGTNEVSGHVDFWPNNGIDQPGCQQNILSTIVDVEGIIPGLRNVVACNHLRSIFFFTESITSTCNFTAHQCTSYTDYINGKCLQCPDEKCISMGYNSIDSKDAILQNGSPHYYGQTEAFSPYCHYMTFIKVTLGSKGNSIDGKLFVTLYGDGDSITRQLQLSDESQALQLRPGNSYSYMVNYDLIPKNLNRVKLLWTREDWAILNQHISVSTISVWADSEQKMYNFCGDGVTELKEDERYSFNLC